MLENNGTQNQEPVNNERKMGFFKKLIYSITKFEKYPEMAVEGVPRALKYFAQLMIILGILVSIGLVYQFHTTIQSGASYLQNNLPDMTYSNGELKVDSQEAIEIENENSIVDKVIIDTNVEEQAQIDEYVNSIGEENSGVVILKDEVVIKNEAVVTPTVYKYTDILTSVVGQDLENITKQDVVNYLTGSAMNSIYMSFFIMMFIYTFIIYLISGLVDTVVLAILGNITVLFTKLRIKFSAVYNMAVYGLTLSILLNAIYIMVNMITGFEIKYFQVMYTSIAYIYLVAAIFMIKSDFTKRQSELMKIIDTQQEVREEMEQKEREKKENEEKEEKEKNKDTDKKDEEKKEKKRKDENGGSNEPTGSQA